MNDNINNKIIELKNEERILKAEQSRIEIELKMTLAKIKLLEEMQGLENINPDNVSRVQMPTESDIIDIAHNLIVTKNQQLERVRAISTELRKKGFSADNINITKILEDSGKFKKDKTWIFIGDNKE